MATIELAYHLNPILTQLPGNTFTQKIARVLSHEIRRYLSECEQQILELEIRYGLEYQDFRRKLEVGELGNEFSYPLEEDAMQWEDLVIEKKHWLGQLRTLETEFN